MYVEIKSKSGYMVYHYWFSFSSGGGGDRTGQVSYDPTGKDFMVQQQRGFSDSTPRADSDRLQK